MFPLGISLLKSPVYSTLSSSDGLQDSALVHMPRNAKSPKEALSADSVGVCFSFGVCFSRTTAPPPLNTPSSCLDSTLASAAASFPSSPSAAIPARREIGRPFGAMRPRSEAVDSACRTVQRLLLACGAFHDTGIGGDLAYRTKASPKDLCHRDLNHHLQALLTARVALCEFLSDRELQVRCCRYSLYRSPSKESS